jgi:putative transferase (TIGR04331 family)
LPSVWSDPAKVAEAYDYVQRISERLLSELTRALNDLHRIERSERFWRILLGAWLGWYTGALFDRFVTVRAAIDKYPKFKTIGLAPECFVVPFDTLEFSSLLCEDGYNLQFFSRILEFLGYDYPHERLEVVPAELERSEAQKAWRDAIARLFLGVLPTPALLWKGTYFGRRVEIELLWRLWSAAGPFASPRFRPNRCAPDPDRRGLLQQHLSGGSEFEILISRVLPLDLPLCFIEQFAAVARVAERSYPSRPKAIFSSTSWYYDEAFKYWAALAAAEGTVLMGTQHGANYGGPSRFFGEEHETKCVDRYYSWGWEATGHRCEIVPMPGTRLCRWKQLGPAPSMEAAVLFVLTCGPRYLVEFPYIPERFSEYLQWQQRFVRRLSPETMTNLRVRPHYLDYGWGIRSWWEQEFPGVELEDWSMTFPESLSRCRLYVCDHCSTTFGEALAADKPTILFWDPAVNELRPAAQPYYDQLRRAGILFDSPEGAAEAVSAVYDHVEQWWTQPEVQSARISFCERFARTSKTAVRDWAAELRTIARNGFMGHRSPGINK